MAAREEWITPRLEDRAACADGEDAARLEGARLLARTLQHLIGNQLALTVGYTELLLEDPALPPHLRAMACEAHAGALAAAATVQRSAELRRLAVVPQRPEETALLDLERSADPSPPSPVRRQVEPGPSGLSRPRARR